MATYYISPTGNDTTGNGSSGNPWKTVSKAYTASTTGDTIIALAGTYTSFGTFPSTFKDRTLQGVSATTTIFDNGGSATAFTLNGQGSTTTLKNITFQNAIPASQYDPVFKAASDTAGLLTFESCIFTNISVSQANVNWGGLISPANSGSSVNIRVTLNSCFFNDIKNANIGGFHTTIVSADGTSSVVTVTNCTAYYLNAVAATRAIDVFSVRGTLTVKNCIFYNGSGSTITFYYNSPTTANISYSDFYLITSSPSGTGVITSDPLFVDAAGGNFRLRPTSPCLNTGTAN